MQLLSLFRGLDTREPKGQVGYQEHATSSEHCSKCSYWLGGKCARVLGKINAEGWCKRWEPRINNAP